LLFDGLDGGFDIESVFISLDFQRLLASQHPLHLLVWGFKVSIVSADVWWVGVHFVPPFESDFTAALT